MQPWILACRIIPFHIYNLRQILMYLRILTQRQWDNREAWKMLNRWETRKRYDKKLTARRNKIVVDAER